MTLHLTTEDVRRVADAAEALLSPLTAGSTRDWWTDAEARLRDAFPRANVMLTFPEGGRLRFDSVSVDAKARHRLAELAAADPRTGRFRNRDAAVEAWHRYQRAHRLEAWSEGVNRRVYARLGLDFDRSPYVAEGLYAAGLRDYVGLTTHGTTGELFLTIGYDRAGRSMRGHDGDLTLLQLLLPGLRACHQALAQLAGRRAALAATIDAGDDALLVVGPDGRELHRSAALRALLATEPDRERVLARMKTMAAECRAIRRRLASGLGPPGASCIVPTALGCYDLRAVLAAPLLWGEESVVQVSARRAAAIAALPSALAPEAAERVRRDPALTAREREVATLLARRATDAEIAAALGVSWHTARRHAERVLRKLGVHSRTQVALALHGGAPGAP